MNKKILIIRIVVIILIIMWMYSVFSFSNQDGYSSTSLSMRISSLFSKDPEKIFYIDQYIRKLAHFSEYGLGGVLFLSLLKTFNIIDEKRLIISTILGLLYASTDEIHQLFINGRSGQFTDVIIDTMGVITGSIFMCLVINSIKIIRRKGAEKNQEVCKN